MARYSFPRVSALLWLAAVACEGTRVDDAMDAGWDAETRADGSVQRDAEPQDARSRDAGRIMSEPYPSLYPLELVLPRAAGTAAEGTRGVGNEPGAPLPAIPATHRIFKAYPGIEYNIRAAVIGGSYPYTYALRDAPPGMTIDAATGEIRWPSPSETASPTIVVTDMERVEVSATWTIAVGAEPFLFVDAERGAHYPDADGSVDNPYLDFVDVWRDPSARYGDIVYFRRGVYSPDGIERGGVGGDWEGIDWGFEHPQTWLAYPGEVPILDFGYEAGVDASPLFRVNGGYIDGFETINSRMIAFQISDGHYNVFRRLNMHRHNPGGEELGGGNPASIMSTDGENWYTVIQDCEFHENPTAGGLKLYNEGRMLIEDNLFHDSDSGCDWKVGIERGTFRGNRLWALTRAGIFGNMNTRFDMFVRNGEIDYNFFDLADLTEEFGAVILNWDSLAHRIDVYRNTIVGPTLVASVDAEDGPFVWSRNVIVNGEQGVPAGSHIDHYEVSEPTRIILDENIVGDPSDGIVDAEGNLTEAYAEYRGTHGHRVRF
jgi:hypothetical protein